MAYHMERILTGLALSAAGLAAPLAALTQAPDPAPNAPLLVLSPDPVNHVQRAGGWVIGPVTARFGVLAYGDSAVVDRLYTAGAWRVTDGTWFAALCGLDPS